MKGSSIANLWGKFNPGEAVTVFANKGMVAARRLPKQVTITVTKKVKDIRDAFTYFSIARNQLSTYWRAEWSAWAAMKYSAHLKEKHMVARWPWYMKQHAKEISSWSTAYMYCNMLAFSCGMSYPRNKPPLSGGPPPAPAVVILRYDEVKHKVIGEVLVFPLEKYDVDFCARLWMAGQYVTAIPQSIHKMFSLGPGPSKDMTKKVVLPFEFDRIRVAGTTFNMKDLKFKDMAYGSLFIYADCVTAYSHEHGPWASVFSNTTETHLPPRVDLDKMSAHTGGKMGKIIFLPGKKLTPAAMKIYNMIRKKVHKSNRRYKAKLKYVNLTKW